MLTAAWLPDPRQCLKRRSVWIRRQREGGARWSAQALASSADLKDRAGGVRSGVRKQPEHPFGDFCRRARSPKRNCRAQLLETIRRSVGSVNFGGNETWCDGVYPNPFRGNLPCQANRE